MYERKDDYSMKKKMIALVAATALAAALVVTGCSSNSTDNSNSGTTTDNQTTTTDTTTDNTTTDNGYKLVKAGTLTMVTEATYPPFESVNDTTGEVEGFDIDMMSAVAEKLGLKLEVKQMDFDLLVAAVAAGTDADVSAAGMGITDERLETVDFSDLYYSDQLAIAVMKDSGITADNLDAKLANGKIAVQAGTTGESQMLEDYPNATVIPLAKTNDCFAGLLTGDYDAVCTNAAVVNQMINATYSDATVVKTISTGEEYAIAINKDNTQLKEDINKALAELTADGTLADLLAKWGL